MSKKPKLPNLWAYDLSPPKGQLPSHIQFTTYGELYQLHNKKNPKVADAVRSHQQAVLSMKAALQWLLGRDTLPPGMERTPERFVNYLKEFMVPVNPQELLEGKSGLFDGGSGSGVHGMIVQSDIPFRMICEHHLLPATGKAHVGYIPDGKVVGLSKLTRLVQRMGTAKPTLQELVCEEITNALDTVVHARGTIVVVQAEHSCMACRGVNAPGVRTSTSCVRGLFRDVQSAREEFFYLIHQR